MIFEGSENNVGPSAMSVYPNHIQTEEAKKKWNKCETPNFFEPVNQSEPAHENQIKNRVEDFIAVQPHTRTNSKNKILIGSRFYFKTTNIKTMSHLGPETRHDLRRTPPPPLTIARYISSG